MGSEDVAKRDGSKQPQVLWFGQRLGKRSQDINSEAISENQLEEFLENVKNFPELQKILAERFQLEGLLPYVLMFPSTLKQQNSHLPLTPRLGRDAPDSSQLHSRPFPPRYGRQFGGLPPYLPRLGRSAAGAEDQQME